ncbi:MAG: hypothetical protein SCARUB_04965 [Candidatus Scalindua rubra]|uniref:Tetratricopeptide repeat protein n=1 Tax=Candidatus Scalindua rubra TaxID=1872076 RepID=A0A1E3X2P2_9BACT|nr:MAG: hypothetical protein SCARUB_04965 [Candidatus Scalindua rubra]
MLQTRLIKQIIICLCCLVVANFVHAEPLRLLVPFFIGPKPLSPHVRTTIYFELSKAFRSYGSTDKGAWILYGIEEMREPSHNAAIDAASWPSVHADLVIWGQVHRYDDGVAVQLFLTVTPIIKKRQVRPELWTISAPKYNGEAYRVELDIPGRFYEFEPLILTKDVVIQYEKPEGIPLYRSRQGGETIGFLGELFYFLEIHDDALRLRSDDTEGWVRTKNISKGHSEAITFAKGMVRLLRGDWKGSLESFSKVLENSNIPQNLRVHALIYSGLAKEKTDSSGMQEFEAAYRLNRLDKGAASYLLMSRIMDIVRAKRQSDKTKLEVCVHKFKKDLKSVKVLFVNNDKWLQHIEDFLQ